ncbi:GntR family transcriptional regulator [Desulfosediminicola flagellatus]|uniref:GntR family transcriptional regulator n=1 Tax=Desulfosediminicola flagellatus TaxID=2569541 RepID=UPI0010AD5815|nr:GntR family transcriptional regulator [Desulfosediminicola flagellatus]
MAPKQPTLKRRPNLGQIAYDEIKAMILTGELEPGERLVLDDLSMSLNLSVTPIRDALNKLEQEDLIVITPRTSHSVVQLNATDASDILDLRLMLEMYALESAGKSLSQFPVMEFREKFTSAACNDTPKEFIEADNQFHSAILAMSPNQRLPRLYSYLQNLIQVISVQAIKVEGRIAHANREHMDLLDAIAQQNIELAKIRLKAHFNEMKSVLLYVTR